MGIGSGLYMYDVVVKRSRSLSHLLMSSCYALATQEYWRRLYVFGLSLCRVHPLVCPDRFCYRDIP